MRPIEGPLEQVSDETSPPTRSLVTAGAILLGLGALVALKIWILVHMVIPHAS